MAHILEWHTLIRNRIRRGMSFEPIGLDDIAHFERHLAKLGVEMEPFDEDMLWRVDNIWMVVTSEAQK